MITINALLEPERINTGMANVSLATLLISRIKRIS